MYPFYHNGALMLTVVIPVLLLMMCAGMALTFRAEDREMRKNIAEYGDDIATLPKD